MLLDRKDTHNAFWWQKLNVNKAVFVYQEKKPAAYLNSSHREKKRRGKERRKTGYT